MAHRFGRPRGTAAIVARAERVLKDLPTVDDVQCLPWDNARDCPLAVAPVEVRPWATDEAVVEAAQRAARGRRTVRARLERRRDELSPLFVTAIPAVSDTLHGVMVLARRGAHLDRDDAELAEFFAERVARHCQTEAEVARDAALRKQTEADNAAAIERAHHRAAALNRLAEFTRRMTPEQHSFDALADLLIEISGVDAVSIGVFGADGALTAPATAGRLHPNPQAAAAARALWSQLLKLRSDDALTRELRATLRPIWVPDLRDDTKLHPTVREALISVGLRTTVSVPIVSAGTLKGVVEFGSRAENPIASPDLVETLAAHVGATALAAANMEDLHRAVRDIRELSRDTMLRMGLLCEARDPHTGVHLHSVSSISETIARELGLEPELVDEIGSASVLHDVGKIRVPESLLLKPGSLTPDEWEIMRAHSAYGAELLDSDRFHRVAREIARHHHERWDGRGYPDGLKGMRIPLSAQIVAVADSFDAMMSARPYKPAYDLEYALSEIREHREKQFAPDPADAFLRLIERGEIDIHH